MMRFALIAALSSAATCTPSPTPSPAPVPAPAIDAGAYDAVCAHLAAIGCPQPSTCGDTLRSKQGVLADYKPACLLAAPSAAAAEACGTVRCGP